jgi:hypothetical protein
MSPTQSDETSWAGDEIATGPEITIFSAPKAFVGAAETSQRNAVWSWKQLGPDVEVLLIGDEDGGVSRELDGHAARRSPACVPPNDVFRAGQSTRASAACSSIRTRVRPDSCTRSRSRDWSDRFLMVGQRWILPRPPRQLGGDWWGHTRERASAGKLDSPLIDYFAFLTGRTRTSLVRIGRPATTPAGPHPLTDPGRRRLKSIVALHQRHTYCSTGERSTCGPRTQNADLIGDRRKLFTIGHGTDQLTARESNRPRRSTMARLSTGR